ncbi:hypothetical protein [Vibrio phage phiKT1024]|nr:hypothetical protein [Vibrio phage phiKT1024]
MVRLLKYNGDLSDREALVLEVERRKDTGTIYIGHKFSAYDLKDLLEESNYGLNNIHQSYFSSTVNLPDYELLLTCDNYGDFFDNA